MAVSAALLLIFAAPLMRGGNRQVALIALEAIALALLLSLWLRAVFLHPQSSPAHSGGTGRTLLIAFLLSSPAWLALVYLVPLPSELWFAAPGRGLYQQLLGEAGIAPGNWLSLSLVPDATRASLLAGLLLIAGFLAGYMARLSQLKLLLGVVVAISFAEVVLGLLQFARVPLSGIYWGVDGGNRPVGTFANPNHLANYLAMSLTGYVWLGWDHLLRSGHRTGDNPAARFATRHALALWVAGGVVLVLGILLTRSRGAALTGMPAAMLAFGLAFSVTNRTHGWRFAAVVLGAVLAAAVALLGMDSVISRYELAEVASSASGRNLLASTTLDGSKEFWPWGAGWGTYAWVYPRFQPIAIGGMADYAHQDYSQLLFEGGIFSLTLVIAFLGLVTGRAIRLVKSSRRRRLTHEEMASTICGLGLLGFLLHSLVEFSMHIPANAILAALLAGVYLRPLEARAVQR